MTTTLEQKAALAKVLGITSETHPDFARVRKFPRGGACGQVVGMGGEFEISGELLPDPYGPDADPVWAVPLMEWFRYKNMEPSVRACRIDFPSAYTGIIYARKKDGSGIGLRQAMATTITAALLDAASAAGVSEICAVFGEGEG